MSQPFVARGHTVVGFDNNPAMLELARRKHAGAPEEARLRSFPAEVPGEADAMVC